jgi:hypothetical protein
MKEEYLEDEEEVGFRRLFRSNVVLPSLEGLVSMKLSELFDRLLEVKGVRNGEDILRGGLVSFAYELEYGDARRLGLVPEGDFWHEFHRDHYEFLKDTVIIEFNASGGYDAEDVLSVKMPRGVKITLSDKVTVENHMRVDDFTVRDFIRACLTFAWQVRKNVGRKHGKGVLDIPVAKWLDGDGRVGYRISFNEDVWLELSKYYTSDSLAFYKATVRTLPLDATKEMWQHEATQITPATLYNAFQYAFSTFFTKKTT